MMSMLSDDVRRNPYPLYAQLRSASPVLREPSSGMWLLFDHASVKRALFDHESFSSAVVPPTGKAPDWLIFSDPPRHTSHRAILAQVFTARAVASLEPRIRELSGALLDRVVGQGNMDLVGDYAGPLPSLVIAEMLGIPFEDPPRFTHWAEVIMKLSYAIAGGEEAERAMCEHAAVKEEMRAYLAESLPVRRTANRDDLLSRLVRAEVDGQRLTDDDLLGFFQLLLAAGIETTTNAISNAVLCLLEHPEQLARLRGDRRLLSSALEEVLRYRSPGQIMFRTTRKDVQLHDINIPTGALVLAIIGSANRDPIQFEQPDRFDISRSPNPHLAFGHGIHFCLGAALSRLEARVAIADILDRLPGLALDDPGEWPPRQALNAHGPRILPVCFQATASDR